MQKKIVKLIDEDKKILKYSFRPHIIISSSIFIIGSLFIIGNHTVEITKTGVLFSQEINLRIFAFFMIALLLGLFLTRKTILDLKNGEKILESKIVQGKEKREDYEAGSGVVGRLAFEMKSFQEYTLIIDNVRYKVEKKLFDMVNEGDTVVFHIAAKSGNLIKIENNGIIDSNYTN